MRGFDDSFLNTTTYALAARANGYASPRAVWQALSQHPDLAVVDALAAPRRDKWGFGVPPELRLHGFFIEDGTFDPVPVKVHDPHTGATKTLNVIGVLSDTAPIDQAGPVDVAADREGALRRSRRAHRAPSAGRSGRRPGGRRGASRARVPRPRTRGRAVRDKLHDALGASYTMNWLLLGFMGLGLIVGVAALGVISARAVVERRQQIGVLRSIGFRRGMVQMSFLLESAFIALTAIVVGTTLGLVIARNVVADAAEQASWQGSLQFIVPWTHLAIVFVAVLAAALLTSLGPAARAARVYPAEALRYE